MGSADHPPSPGGDDGDTAPARPNDGPALSLELLAEELVDPVLIWSPLRDDDGVIVDFVYEYVNGAAAETVGIPADELLGERLLEVLPIHVELGLFDRYCAVAETGVTDVIEIPWFEDGNVAGAFEAHVTQVPGGIISIARNVTDRVLAAQRLQATEQRLALLQGHAGEAMIHVVDGVVEWTSPAISSVLGIDPSSMNGTRAAAWCHPEAAHLLDRPSGGTGTAFARVGRLRRSDGSWQRVDVVVERTAGRPGDSGTGVDSVVAVVRPIDEADTQSTASPDLRRSRQQFEAVLDEVPDGVIVMDHGIFEYANAEAARICGFATANELIGRELAEFVSPDELEEATRYGRRVHRSGRSDDKLVMSIRSSTGEQVQVELTATRAPGSDRALLVVFRDVTERNQLIAELARSEATGRFLTENSTDVLLRAGRDRRISFASAASIAILGQRPDDLVGTLVEGLFGPDDREVVAHALDTARDVGVAEPVELQVPLRDATEPMLVELEARSVPLPDGENEFHITLYDVRREVADRESLRVSEHRLKALIDGAPVGIFELDPDGRCTFVNPRYCETVGVDGLDDVAGRRWIGLIHPDDRHLLFEQWSDPSSAREPFELSVRYQRSDDDVYTIVRIEPVLTTEGDIGGWLGTVEDITERVTLERARREATDLFQAAFDHAPTGLSLMTVAEFPPRLVKANAALLQITGLTEEELGEIDFYAVAHPDDVGTAASGRAALLAGEIETHQMEVRLQYPDDPSYRWFDLVRSIVRDDDGTPLHLIAQTTDITDRKNTEQLHYHLAVTDPLTGLSNRRHFEDRLANTHARLLRSEQLIGVIFLDLDHFKVVNDELGHRAGDEVLQRIAEILIAEVRPGDTVARLGGDEFVILAEHQDQEELIRIAERLREAIDVYRVLPSGQPHRISASIGVASRSASDVTPDELVQLADEAMYRAKREGRRRCMVADPF